MPPPCLRRLSLAALLLVAAAQAAAAPPLMFQHLGSREGLPQNTVNATLQDSQGFLWIATEDGLVRFDGYEVHQYRAEPGVPDSLPGNYVWALAEDPGGDLWIATKDAGLARWHRRTDRFTHYRHEPGDPAGLPGDTVRRLLVDDRGRLWIGTTGAGLALLDPSTGRFRNWRHDPADARSLSSDVVTALWRDDDGNLWIGPADGLNRWLPADDAFERFVHDAADPRSLPSNRVAFVGGDAAGRLWVGTTDAGLGVLERGRPGFRNYRARPGVPGALPHDEIRAVLQDSAGRLWIGTARGLALHDPVSDRFEVYANDPRDPSSLRDGYVMSLHEDRRGLLWVGTRAGGVSRWEPRTWLFGHERPAWADGAYAMSFAEDSAGRLWVGTLGAGLARHDAASATWTPFERVRTRGATLADRRIMALLKDRRDNLWIGTMTGGLARLEPDGNVTAWDTVPAPGTAPPARGVMSLLEDSRGRIWVGTFGAGVAIHDPSSGAWRHAPHESGASAPSGGTRATALLEDPLGNVWIGTDGDGLALVRPDGTLLASFRRDRDDPQSIASNTVYSLALDAQGRVWAATEGGGLNLVIGSSGDPAAIRFRAYAKREGLTSSSIYGIRTDLEGALWLSGNAGLMRFYPETAEVRAFHREHGLQHEEFNFGSHFRTRDGRMVFGGPNGFNVFDPAALRERPPPPRVVLTGVEVMNRPAAVDAPYPMLDRLHLGHRDAVVSFEFAGLDFAAPEKIRYGYRLVGFDEDWVELRRRRTVSYTNLEAGDYAFEVRAAGPDGSWGPATLRLPVTVDPAPWRSGWAWVAYTAAVLLLLWSWHARQQRRVARATAAARSLELEVALRTRDLAERNEDLARASRAKTDFLARMSHEIRTPMSGVLGTAELLLQTALDARQRQLATTIRASGRALLDILNDILDLARVESGRMRLEQTPFDLAAVLADVVDLLAPQAHAKGLELVACAAPELRHHVVGDPLRVRQLVTNLLGNAIKFTTHGQVEVNARVVGDDGTRVRVAIEVADTGIGMDEATAARVFEPFTQADESTTRRYGGSGLGLAICREMVALMGGSIAVRSRPGTGSTFTVSLALGRGAPLPAAAAPELARWRVRIACRRPALLAALARETTAFGLAVESDDDAAAASPGPLPEHSLELVDLGDEDLVLPAPGDAAGRVFLCTPDGAAHQALVRAGLGSCALPKPVRREALGTALGAAAGLAPAPDAARVAERPQLGARVLVVEDTAE
ncbi:MAG: two-component regulator propeller domain-containing protein, partial [Pseudomonadota bacterium]